MCSAGIGESCTGAGRRCTQLRGCPPMAAYGRLFLLYAAALSTPPTSSREVAGDPPMCRNQPSTQLWCLVCTAQRHKGGARRAGDSRGAVHTKCQSEHRTGTGDAPQLCTPSARASTELERGWDGRAAVHTKCQSEHRPVHHSLRHTAITNSPPIYTALRNVKSND